MKDDDGDDDDDDVAKGKHFLMEQSRKCQAGNLVDQNTGFSPVSQGEREKERVSSCETSVVVRSKERQLYSQAIPSLACALNCNCYSML